MYYMMCYAEIKYVCCDCVWIYQVLDSLCLQVEPAPFFPHKSRSFVPEHQAYGTSQSHHHVRLIRIHKILIILSTSKHLRDHDHREHFKAPSLSISMPSPNQSALTSGEWDRSQHSKQASHLLHQEPLLQQSWPWHSLPRGSRWGFWHMDLSGFVWN